MLADLTPKQRQLVLDPSPHVAGLCPRRAGKSYAGATAALALGESKPGSISLIISLNKMQLRRLYWSGGPSGLFTLDRKYGLNIKFNNTYLSWEHQNGSIGYLLGCDDDDQLEVIRGLEADLYLIDECKSFAPGKLNTLIDDIIDPQRATRRGRIVMIGTPGFIMAGPFYEATCPEAKDKEGNPLSVAHGSKDPLGRTPENDLLWSRHHWTLQDNTAKRHQWTEALKKKRQKGWTDEDPTWLREYMGQWTHSSDGLVFRYSDAKRTGKATWLPERSAKNVSGLPEAGAPWRYIAGLDLGFEEPTAIVVGAYSQKLRELRHVWDEMHSHLLPDQIVELVKECQNRFGTFERVYADGAGLGRSIIALLAQEGIPVEKADKREKYDYIELLNSSLTKDEVKVIEGTDLSQQLLTVAWDLGDAEKADLAKLGKLKEDPSVPNDCADAFLYMYRGSLHQFGKLPTQTLDPNSDEYHRQWEITQLRKFRERARNADAARLGGNTAHVRTAPQFVRNALRIGSDRWKSTPSSSRKSWNG